MGVFILLACFVFLFSDEAYYINFMHFKNLGELQGSIVDCPVCSLPDQYYNPDLWTSVHNAIFMYFVGSHSMFFPMFGAYLLGMAFGNYLKFVYLLKQNNEIDEVKRKHLLAGVWLYSLVPAAILCMQTPLTLYDV